jgi:hypothetical protein
MAFLIYSNISSDLPTGSDSKLVSRLLVRLEQDLKSLGLAFSDPSPTTEDIKGENGSYNDIFDFKLAKSITDVSLKTLGSTSSTTLTLNQDYSLVEHPSLAGYYYRIEMLNRRLYPTEYLSMTAKFGCFIDFKSGVPTDESAILLQGIIIDFIIKQLRYNSTNYQQISRSKTGDTDVQFTEIGNSKYYSSILLDPEFRSSLSYFTTI